MTEHTQQLRGHVRLRLRLSLAHRWKREASGGAQFIHSLSQHLLTDIRPPGELFHTLLVSLSVTQQQLLWRLKRPESSFTRYLQYMQRICDFFMQLKLNTSSSSLHNVKTKKEDRHKTKSHSTQSIVLCNYRGCCVMQLYQTGRSSLCLSIKEVLCLRIRLKGRLLFEYNALTAGGLLISIATDN